MILALAPQDDAVGMLRTVAAPSVVVVIHPGRDAAGLSLARAAIGAAAMAQAPRRINAVQPAAGIAPADIDRAVAYLIAAPAVTGQIVELS